MWLGLGMINAARRALRPLYALYVARHIASMRGRVFDLNRKARVDMEGFSLFVMPDDYIGKSILTEKGWEPHVTAVIRRELRVGNTFLDVGANLGYFAMLARSIVGDAGKVYAVEPNPQNLQLIYESQLANGYTDISVLPYAASDHASILRLDTIGSNGVLVTEHVPDQKFTMLVPSLRIDDLIDAPIDMIKIDVEAHETLALVGMSRLLESRPKLVTEFHPWAMRRYNAEGPEAYLDLLSETLGYRLHVIMDNGDTPAMTKAEILAHWASLGQETIHLDLYCTA